MSFWLFLHISSVSLPGCRVRRKDGLSTIHFSQKDYFLHFLLMLLLSVLNLEEKNVSMPQGGILEMPSG